MRKFLTLMLLFFFILSWLPLSNIQQQSKDSVGLRKVIQQVQNLSGKTDAVTLDFVRSFTSTVTALRAVAGLKTIIIKKTTKNSAGTNAIIICINLPYLPEKFTDIKINISASDINISKLLIVDTSVTLALDTPPPIV